MVLVKKHAPNLNRSYEVGARLRMPKVAPILMDGAKIFLKKTTVLETAKPTAATRICVMEQQYLWQASSSL